MEVQKFVRFYLKPLHYRDPALHLKAIRLAQGDLMMGDLMIGDLMMGDLMMDVQDTTLIFVIYNNTSFLTF